MVMKDILTKVGNAGEVRNYALDLLVSFEHDDTWICFVDDDDTISAEYVAHLRQHAEDHPWAEVIVFRMKDPNYGILPRPNGHLDMGFVGISFAVRTDRMVKHDFISEERNKFAFEDWELLKSIQEDGGRVFISPHIDYFVRDTR